MVTRFSTTMNARSAVFWLLFAEWMRYVRKDKRLSARWDFENLETYEYKEECKLVFDKYAKCLLGWIEWMYVLLKKSKMILHVY